MGQQQSGQHRTNREQTTMGCSGRGQKPPRILRMAVEDRILLFMRISEWPNPSNVKLMSYL
eukprot:6832905-Karenia_brevis.AAC.1